MTDSPSAHLVTAAVAKSVVLLGASGHAVASRGTAMATGLRRPAPAAGILHWQQMRALIDSR